MDKESSSQSQNEFLRKTQSIIQLVFSLSFWTGVILACSASIPSTKFFLDTLHDSSMKESKTKYDISLARVEAEVANKELELKRQNWEYAKLDEKFKEVERSYKLIKEKHSNAIQLHYSYCKDQVRRIEISSTAYERIRQIMTYDYAQSPIEYALYNVFLEANKCINRFEG